MQPLFFFANPGRGALAVAVILGVVLTHKGAVLIVKVGTRLDGNCLSFLEVLLFFFFLPLEVSAVVVAVFTVFVIGFFSKGRACNE